MTVIFIALLLLAVFANIAETRRAWHFPVYIALALCSVAYVVVYLNQISLAASVNKPLQNVPAAVGLIAAACLMALALLFKRTRRRIARWFPARTWDVKQGMLVGYDPSSMVHLTALIFCLFFAISVPADYLLLGGLSELARQFGGISMVGLWVQAFAFILISLAGVGFGLRRRPLLESLQRLGLQPPTLTEIALGVSMAFFLMGVQITFAQILPRLIPPEVLQEQTAFSERISSSVNTLLIGFVLALTAGLGEEIAFRGALQPVFGILPTTLLFTLIHSQYTLTPASLLIFGVGYAFGWLRRSYNTTTAILAHFGYNFLSVSFVMLLRVAEAIAQR